MVEVLVWSISAFCLVFIMFFICAPIDFTYTHNGTVNTLSHSRVELTYIHKKFVTIEYHLGQKCLIFTFLTRFSFSRSKRIEPEQTLPEEPSANTWHKTTVPSQPLNKDTVNQNVKQINEDLPSVTQKNTDSFDVSQPEKASSISEQMQPPIAQAEGEQNNAFFATHTESKDRIDNSTAPNSQASQSDENHNRHEQRSGFVGWMKQIRSFISFGVSQRSLIKRLYRYGFTIVRYALSLISIRRMQIHVTFGCANPFITSLIQSIALSLYPILCDTTRPDFYCRCNPNFELQKMFLIQGNAVLTTSLSRFIRLGLFIVFSFPFLSVFIAYRRMKKLLFQNG